MSVRDSDRASNVDENRSIGASSLAAAVSSDTRSAVQYASSEVGVVVDRRSAWSCSRRALKFIDHVSESSSTGR